MKFEELGLAEPLVRAVKSSGYDRPTPIQSAAIPVVLSSADLIGCAQTGTGKTAAFTLPLLDRLSKKKGAPRPGEPRALILSPTRELAAQIGASLDKYGKKTPLRHAIIYGGVSQFHQVKALKRGVDTVVATPGRLLDLMGQGHVRLSSVEVLVFDEADQMLDMGFLPSLKRIAAAAPSERQTLMFSATMPDEIRQVAQQWLRNPESVSTVPASTPAERIAQSVHLVDKKRKIDLLAHFLDATPRGRTLVFSRTKHGADKIVKQLTRDGVDAAAIHGNKSQNARDRALARFKGKNPPVLIATDIAARGLDVSGVSHVVNFDLPDTPETYVHRIGRTARAGAEGVAVSFCSIDERDQLRDIERLTKQRLRVEPTVDGFQPTEEPTAPTKRPGKGRRPGGQRGGGGSAGARSGAAAKKKKPGAKKTDANNSGGSKASASKSGSGKPRRPGGKGSTYGASASGPEGGAKPRRRKRVSKVRTAL